MKIMNKEIGKEEVIMFIKSGLFVYFLFFPVLLLVDVYCEGKVK